MNNQIFNFLLILLVLEAIYLLICCQYSNIKEKFVDIKEGKNKDIAILLTSCINPTISSQTGKDKKNEKEERLKLYDSVIQKYLNNTKYTFYIIESSGTTELMKKYKDEKRIKYFSFFKKNKYFFDNIHNYSTTGFEAYSILKAFNHFKFHKFNKILKITGKYYIPNLESIVSDFQDEADIYVQNTYSKEDKYQRCEVFGMKSKYCTGIMIDLIRQITIFEEYLFNLYHEHENNKNPPLKAQRMIAIKLDTKVKRAGDGAIVTSL